MYRWVFLLLTVTGVVVGLQWRHRPLDVLFVGNSLTYVGNLPAVLETVAASQGRVVHADMIVRGGATLTDALRQGLVQRALDARHYDVAVLQERGGDVIGGFGPGARKDAEASLRELVRLVRAHGATPVWLGTYQSMPEPSQWLLRAESRLTRRVGVAYVPVADALQRGLAALPRGDWLYADGGHPGHDLVLTEAMLVYRQLFGALPQAQAWTVRAPMYGPHAHFGPPSPVSEAPPVSTSEAMPPRYVYTAERARCVRALLDHRR